MVDFALYHSWRAAEWQQCSLLHKQRRCRQSSGKRRNSHSQCCFDCLFNTNSRGFLFTNTSTVPSAAVWFLNSPLEKVTTDQIVSQRLFQTFAKWTLWSCSYTETDIKCNSGAIFPPSEWLWNSSDSASCFCTCLSPSLYFCSVLECDILNTCILEYVFLMCSINFAFTQNKVLTSVSVSLVLCGPLRQQFQGKRHRRKPGESGAVHTTGFRTTPL